MTATRSQIAADDARGCARSAAARGRARRAGARTGRGSSPGPRRRAPTPARRRRSGAARTAIARAIAIALALAAGERGRASGRAPPPADRRAPSARCSARSTRRRAASPCTRSSSTQDRSAPCAAGSATRTDPGRRAGSPAAGSRAPSRQRLAVERDLAAVRHDAARRSRARPSSCRTPTRRPGRPTSPASQRERDAVDGEDPPAPADGKETVRSRAISIGRGAGALTARGTRSECRQATRAALARRRLELDRGRAGRRRPASAQRGSNGQPGRQPRRARAARPGSARGIAPGVVDDRRPPGAARACRGGGDARAAPRSGRVSTIRPAYMTATSLADAGARRRGRG